MRVILLSLFAGSIFANALLADNNATAPNPETTQVATQSATTPAPVVVPADPDIKLKDDIVGFERERHFQNDAKIDDPFIYVYPQTEDEVARRAELERIVHTFKLRSIIVSPDSTNSVKRYKAHINNKWVEECRLVDKKTECDVIEGWKVVSINADKVTLKVDSYNLKKDLPLVQKKVAIEKKEVNYR